jgi:hypothetical protein
MKEKIVSQLEKLQSNFSEELLGALMENLKDLELVEFESILINNAKLFNKQDERFYDELAIQFVDDLNNSTLLYFYSWEHLINIFEDDTREYFYNTALAISNEDNASQFINGFKHQQNDEFEYALLYFNATDSYIAKYFIGWCYLLLDNPYNAIKNNLIFLDKLENQLVSISNDSIDISNDSYMQVIKWNVYNDLGYCYNRIENYKMALDYYNKGLDILNLEENYKLKHQPDNDNQYADDFTIFINNYLLSLEKIQDYSKCLDILDFMLDKKPTDIYYQNKRKEFEKKPKDSAFVTDLISNLIEPNRKISKYVKAKILSKEKSLEDMIDQQIKNGFKVFNKNLEIYDDKNIHGRQYYISEVNGFLDLLLIDNNTKIVYVVELKRNKAGVEVVDQIEKYIYGIKHEIDNEIRGIICVHRPDQDLINLVNQKQHIDLFTYDFDFKKIE